MNAPHLPSPRSPESSRSRPPRRRRASAERADRMTWAAAWETSLKLAVDLTVSLGAIAALVRLVPSYTTSRVELEKLETEVATTQSQVSVLQGEFARYFDPTLVKVLMQEQQPHVDPNRRPIVFVESDEGDSSP